MREVRSLLWFAVRAGALLLLSTTPNAFASTIQVPENFPNIQAAVNAAAAGDTIRVGPGEWCGARITKRLDLEGEGGATIIGCPAGVPGPVNIFGGRFRVGFFLNTAASGTAIRHFTFDGRGWSATNLAPLAFEIFTSLAFGPANDVIVEHNQFLGSIFPVSSGGNGWSIDHNVFDGFTIDSVTGIGGGAMELFNAVSRAKSNTVSFNKMTTTAPPGSFPSFVSQINIPFLGVFAGAQDGMVLTNNEMSVALGAGATGAAAGILVSDIISFTTGADLTSINSVIVNNDGRRSTLSVVITKDLLGGTGNTVNATLRGNFGVNSIDTLSTDVRNRSIHTLVECDSSGVCP